MKALTDYSDQRLRAFCIYCGRRPETRDHIPPKFLLDEPLPGNVHVVPACKSCNGGFSKDEVFVGCLLDAWRVGTPLDPARLRPKVRSALERSPRLATAISRYLDADPSSADWSLALRRIEKLLVKLAKGHAAYDLGESYLLESEFTSGLMPIDSMGSWLREQFEDVSWDELVWPEMGTRKLSRILNGMDEWVIIQDEIYRYHASISGSCYRIRIVLQEFFAAEVVFFESDDSWDSNSQDQHLQ